MASIREQILARIKVALTAAAPGGANVSRSREVAITRALSPSVVIMAHGNAVSAKSTELDQNAFDVELEIFVRGDPWDLLVDPIDQAAHTALMTDAPLLALVSCIRRSSEAFASQEADLTAGVLSVRYRIDYLTRATDISRGA
jgi:hypothetical protein